MFRSRGVVEGEAILERVPELRNLVLEPPEQESDVSQSWGGRGTGDSGEGARNEIPGPGAARARK